MAWMKDMSIKRTHSGRISETKKIDFFMLGYCVCKWIIINGEIFSLPYTIRIFFDPRDDNLSLLNVCLLRNISKKLIRSPVKNFFLYLGTIESYDICMKWDKGRTTGRKEEEKLSCREFMECLVIIDFFFVEDLKLKNKTLICFKKILLWVHF